MNNPQNATDSDDYHVSDEEFARLAAHYEECPLPPDAGCDCNRHEMARRTRCHGSIATCRASHDG